MLTQEKLQELLHYCPDTGIFMRKHRKQKAGTLETTGYIRIKVGDKLYRAHRLAWLYVHGRFPVDQIDHINQIKDDNRISNLREATNAQNQRNISNYPRNTSGVIGVNWHKKTKKWYARLGIDNKRISVGYFDSIEDASIAMDEARDTYWLEF